MPDSLDTRRRPSHVANHKSKFGTKRHDSRGNRRSSSSSSSNSSSNASIDVRAQSQLSESRRLMQSHENLYGTCKSPSLKAQRVAGVGLECSVQIPLQSTSIGGNNSTRDASPPTTPGVEAIVSSFLIDDSTDDESASFATTSDLGEKMLRSSGLTTDVVLAPLLDDAGWTFEALVDRLLSAHKTKADTKFVAIFLALYRIFAPPSRLLEAISARFEILDKSDDALLLRYTAQLRYLEIVETWLRLYPGDFAFPKTLRRIRTLISKLSKQVIFAHVAREMASSLYRVRPNDDTTWAFNDENRYSEEASLGHRLYTGSILIDDPDFDFCEDTNDLSLRRQTTRSDRTSTDSSEKSGAQIQKIPPQHAAKLLPTGRLSFSKHAWTALLQVSPESIAKEMTRMDWALFRTIQPRDLIRHIILTASQKQECKSLANVNRMIEHFNYLRDWVINYILYRDKAKHRAQMLEKFMLVARKLRELNNYNALGAVLAGIQSVQVHRLDATRALVPASVTRDCTKLSILMSQSRSHASYRLAWENTRKERIPYMPLQIRDLIGAENGNKTFLGDGATAKINWRKFAVMGEVLVGIQKAQGLPYRAAVLGSPHEDVNRLILHLKIRRDNDDLYERSCMVEPGKASDSRSSMSEKKGNGLKDLFRRSSTAV